MPRFTSALRWKELQKERRARQSSARRFAYIVDQLITDWFHTYIPRSIVLSENLVRHSLPCVNRITSLIRDRFAYRLSVRILLFTWKDKNTLRCSASFVREWWESEHGILDECRREKIIFAIFIIDERKEFLSSSAHSEGSSSDWYAIFPSMQAPRLSV